jgi:hypothetical protein
MSVLGATVLLAASVVGASSASALALDAAAPPKDFGNVPVYSTVQQPVVVTASGGPVQFGAVPFITAVNGAQDQADDYSFVSTTCTGTIAAEATCTVTIAFNPFAAGLRAATLNIGTISPSATLLVSLTGTGVPDATGTYYGLATPTRFLDTRGPTKTGPRLAAGSTTSVQIAGRSNIPATGVSAVVLNLTAVTTTSQGFFTVFPSGTTRPTASTINFPSGWTGANMATVPLGADGKISIFNYGGAAHAIVDVLGWYAKDDSVRTGNGMGAQFLSTASGDPERIYDSRKDPDNGNLPFVGGDFIQFTDTWDTAASATAVKAYAMNITAVDATTSGVLTAWAGGTVPKPNTSTVNYVKGTIAPNMSVVPAGHLTATTTGFRVQNTGSGSVHMVVDIIGYYLADDSAGLRFKPLASGAPVRILDTRTNVGLSGSFGPNQTRTAPATSVANVDSIYVVGNTTGDKPTSRTYLTVWSGDNVRPLASTLNVNAGATRAVSTYASLAFNTANSALTYNVYNNAGTMRVIFDAVGTLDLYPGSAVLPASTTSADSHAAARSVRAAGAFADGHKSVAHRRS